MESAVLSICIVSLAVSVSENLVSGTKLGKQIKFILSLILIAVIFRPFSESAVLPDIFDFISGIKYKVRLCLERDMIP